MSTQEQFSMEEYEQTLLDTDVLSSENESDDVDEEQIIATSKHANDNINTSIVIHEDFNEDASAILTPEQYKEFLKIGKVTDLEEGACQEGDVAVRAMLMAGYMREQVLRALWACLALLQTHCLSGQTYTAAKHDVKEMERVAKWFNKQDMQARGHAALRPGL